MAVEYYDLVEDYTASSGTGPFTLYNEVITHRQRPASVLSIGDQWPCVITHTTLNEWQTGTATYLGSNQFEITTPRDGSSGSGVRVSFSAGLKTVRLDVIAHHILDNVAATATSASNASTSASNAATSATAASSSATAAAASASAASTSASNAASSASAASTSATNAATSAAIAANAAGFTFTYSTTTSMADPGTGVVRFNSGTLASVTSVAIDDLAADSGNPDVSAWIGTFNDSSNGTTKGLLRLRKSTAAQNYVDYSVTGLVDNSGWTELAVTYVGSSGTLSNGDTLLTSFYQAGDKGADGVGAGDVLGPASTTDGVIALWNGTSGDLLKQATTTGILKASSGVLSAAVAGTDYVQAQLMPNLLINPDFQINQRGFAGGSLSAGVYGFDRWKAGTGGCSISISGFTVTLASGPIAQVIEPDVFGYSSFASTSFTVSVDAPSVNLSVSFGSASGTITSGSGRRSVTLTTGAGDTGNLTLTISAGSSATFGRVKLEVGSSATEWQARPSAVEVVLCQRYFSKSMRLTTAPADGAGYNTDCVFGVGCGLASDTAYSPFVGFPTRMRTLPTITFYRSNLGSTAGRWQYLSGGWVDASSMSVPGSSETGFIAQMGGSFTAGAALAVIGGWTASAEL